MKVEAWCRERAQHEAVELIGRNLMVTFYDFPQEHRPHRRTGNVIESPFPARLPHRSKQGEPAFIMSTASGIAEVRGESLETIAAAPKRNAKWVYRVWSARQNNLTFSSPRTPRLVEPSSSQPPSPSGGRIEPSTP